MPARQPARAAYHARTRSAANKAGKSVDEATASINLSAKYPGYKNERYKAAIQVIYDELKAASPN